MWSGWGWRGFLAGSKVEAMSRVIFEKHFRGWLTSLLIYFILLKSSPTSMAPFITYKLKKTPRSSSPVITPLYLLFISPTTFCIFPLWYSLHPWYFKQNCSSPLTNLKPSLTGLHVLDRSILQNILSHKLVVITGSLPLFLTLHRSFILLVRPLQALTFTSFHELPYLDPEPFLLALLR